MGTSTWRRALLAAAASGTLAASAVLPLGATAGASPAPRGPFGGDRGGPTASKVAMGFFEQWSIYGRGFDLSNADNEGEIADLTHLDYAFGGVNPQTKGQAVQEDPSQPAYNPVLCNSVDSWADYQTPYLTPITGANGQPQPTTDPATGLGGNFEQLAELKAKYPNLKVMMSLGGYTGSGFFSAAASSPAAREAFVSSCINEFIKGDLPGMPSGAAGNIFDGFDIDWEYPCASPTANNGAAGNLCDYNNSNDGADLVALMREFRQQLDQLSQSTHKQYTLTVEMPAGLQNAVNEQPAALARYVDYEVIMDYDFQGPWDATGPTNFDSNLFTSPAAPNTAAEPLISADSSVRYYESRGVRASQLVMGMPYYGHGWAGVAAGNDYGLYQPASGPATSLDVNSAGQQVTGLDGGDPSGTSDYYELANMPGFSWHFDPATGATWLYNPTSQVFWSIENPAEVYEKALYIDTHGLAGASVWALEGDSGNALTSALAGGLAQAAGPQDR
ncbi:MAG TPA: glycosyl hydrolase family 18 protein [Acidimicrobiales bacterium]|nr:glycosyl hydrolase family 18 protein [Acidimicrobiales bacterium]